MKIPDVLKQKNWLYIALFAYLSHKAKEMGVEGNEIMQNWGFAAAFSGWAYNIISRMFKSEEFENAKENLELTAAELTMYCCSIAEIIQGLDIPWIEKYMWAAIGKVYDPIDFIAYGVGISSAFFLEKGVNTTLNSKYLRSSSIDNLVGK